MTRGGEGGFSLVEMVVAAALLLAVTAAVYGALSPSHGAFRVQPETADMQQRLRVAVDILSRDLALAGAGPSFGQNAGPMHRLFAPVLPYRQGRRSPDAPGTLKADTITLLHAVDGGAQTTLAQSLPAQSGSILLAFDPGCPAGDPGCGFKTGMDVIVFDDTGSSDTFTVASVAASSVSLVHNTRDSSKVYQAGVSRIVQAASRTFYLKVDRSADTVQLMQYDGAGGADVPAVDHVVGLSFEYFSDPTTTVSTGAQLTRLSSVELTDGPWRPDSSDPNRYDADLLRVRAVAVTLRVESSAASLRGPAGALFARAGTATDSRLRLPDQEVRFLVAPRNMNVTR